MKFKKNVAKGLVLGIIIANLPLDSFANNFKNGYYNKISQAKIREDLQKVKKATTSIENDTWIENLASMPTKRYCFTSAVVDGKIYCIGGYNGSYLNIVEVYDPETDSWETKTPMPTSRNNLTSAVVDGKIYCIGGYDYYSPDRNLNIVEVYDPVTDSWETKTPMPTKRSSLISASVDGKIYCIGGYNGSYLNIVEVYDPKTDSWDTKANMLTKRGTLTSAFVDGKIYCIGGYNGSYLNIVEVYDPKTDSWDTKTPMPTSRNNLTSVVVDEKIYCIGGSSSVDKYLNIVEEYNSITDSWDIKTSMPTKRNNLASAVVDGKIYCIGGYNDSSYLNVVEAYVAKITLEQEAKDSVNKAEMSKEPEDIGIARDLVNKLPEGELKTKLQDRLNTVVLNISLCKENITSNTDIYIKPENNLTLSIDTNSIVFEDVSNIEDCIKNNAVELTVLSTLPYQVNASIEGDIKNLGNTSTINKNILSIKSSTSSEYNNFSNDNSTITILDNQSPGEFNMHNIDLKLNKGSAYTTDIYKLVLKIEIKQK